MYIPDDFGTVFPYMIVEHAEEFVTFLKNGFQQPHRECASPDRHHHIDGERSDA
jgi:hypothetical protein